MLQRGLSKIDIEMPPFPQPKSDFAAIESAVVECENISAARIQDAAQRAERVSRLFSASGCRTPEHGYDKNGSSHGPKIE